MESLRADITTVEVIYPLLFGGRLLTIFRFIATLS